MSIFNIILAIFLVVGLFYTFYLISELEDLRTHLDFTAMHYDGLLKKLEELEKKAGEDVYCLDITEDKVYEHFKEIYEYAKVMNGKENNNDLD